MELDPTRTSQERAGQPLARAPLRVGRVDDPLERAADEVAARVMALPEPGPSLLLRSGSGAGLHGSRDPTRPVRRQPAEGADEPEEPYPFPSEPIGLGVAVEDEDGAGAVEVRRKPSDGRARADAGAAIPAGSSSPAREMAASVRAWMEPRLGAPLGDVRIHTDVRAAQAARALAADAFTVGRDIYFARGRYRPDASAGRRLLAHELAHVLQAGPRPVTVRRSIAAAFASYRDTCDCGEDLGNNCAHYLSDAFIRSGYAGELDGGTGAKYRRFNGRIVCRSGRPVRAKEFRDWFAGKASSTHEGEPDGSGSWAVYQERRRDGQGHVNIHSHTDDAYSYVGTTDLPTWRTQTHYSW